MIEPSIVLKGEIKGHGRLLDDALIADEMTEAGWLKAVEVGHAWLLAEVC
jgi:hypothetical protein